MKARIAIVEDEPDLREAVAVYLGANGFDVTEAATAAEMRKLAETSHFDLAILDIAMPGEDGLSLGRWLRSHSRVGLIYATAAGTPIDRIVGLELGADDYMVKPYELRELLARVRSVLRRTPADDDLPAPNGDTQPEPARSQRLISFGDYTADLDGRVLTTRHGRTVDLAKSEFDILEVFLARPNRLLTRGVLSEAIGIKDDHDTSRAVDIRIMRLRKKIETDPAEPRFLRTVRGEGYIFALPLSHGR